MMPARVHQKKVYEVVFDPQDSDLRGFDRFLKALTPVLEDYYSEWVHAGEISPLMRIDLELMPLTANTRDDKQI